MSVRARHTTRPMILRLLVACGVALVPAQQAGAQSSPSPVPQALLGTWHLVTKHPVYDSTRVIAAPTQPSRPPVLVPRDAIRFADGPFPVPPRPSDAYSLWVEMNPRDSIIFAMEDSTLTIFADGAYPTWWTANGVARQEAVGEQLFLTRAEWKKDVLVLERSRPSGGMSQRRFRLLKDGRLELTWPGIYRHPDFPTKYVFSRERPVAKP
ncbi:MAG: hypothetical protein KA267_10775 [Gemmatimonadales bacterium]|nr:hypothetical protein [Gemmatimonadales bacterium]